MLLKMFLERNHVMEYFHSTNTSASAAASATSSTTTFLLVLLARDSKVN